MELASPSPLMALPLKQNIFAASIDQNEEKWNFADFLFSANITPRSPCDRSGPTHIKGGGGYLS